MQLIVANQYYLQQPLYDPGWKGCSSKTRIIAALYFKEHIVLETIELTVKHTGLFYECKCRPKCIALTGNRMVEFMDLYVKPSRLY